MALGRATAPLVLAGLFLAGTFGAWRLGLAGLDAFFGETEREVEHAGDYARLNQGLEHALLLWSFACLLALVAISSLFALVKGMIDDVSRARRGPVTMDEALHDAPPSEPPADEG